MDSLTIEWDTGAQKVGCWPTKGRWEGHPVPRISCAWFYIHIRLDMLWSPFSPFGLIGVVRGRLTIV